MSTTSSNENNNNVMEQRRKRKVQVAVVGAGAAGLMCCYEIVQQRRMDHHHHKNNDDNKSASVHRNNNNNNNNRYDDDDIIILEARDRIGGRIYTTVEMMETISTSIQPTTIYRDHGAAWVHGTGYDWPNYCNNNNNNNNNDSINSNSINNDKQNNGNKKNPMMELLEKITLLPNNETEKENTNICLTHLEPISPLGNPWMRPKYTLLRTDNIVLFVDGKQQLGGYNRKGMRNNKMCKTFEKRNHQQQQQENQEGEDHDDHNIILLKALEKHEEIMKDVCAIGKEYILNGQTIKTVQLSLQDVLEQVLNDDDDDDDDSNNNDNNSNNDYDSELISLVAGFYRYLIECWHGTSASKLQLLDFCANDNNQDEEKERDDNNNQNNDDNDYHDDDKDEDDDNDDEYIDEGDFYGPHCTLKQGMQTMLKPLIETALPFIHLNEPVVSISKEIVNDNADDQVKTCIRLKTSNGTVIDADYCVVTVPLGCLAASIKKTCGIVNDEQQQRQQQQHETQQIPQIGTISFQPDLTPAKVQAIQHMEMGNYKKVFLTFDRIFWPIEQSFLGLIRTNNEQHDELGNYLLFDNLWAHKDIPCLEAILIGNAGIWATNKTDVCIRDAVLAFLAYAMNIDLNNELKKWCVDCHITRWEEDPYSRGAYSGYKLGTLEEHTCGLASPEYDGRLIFAGEATVSGDEGSVHAALISGRTSADFIATRLYDTGGCK